MLYRIVHRHEEIHGALAMGGAMHKESINDLSTAQGRLDLCTIPLY